MDSLGSNKLNRLKVWLRVIIRARLKVSWPYFFERLVGDEEKLGGLCAVVSLFNWAEGGGLFV